MVEPWSPRRRQRAKLLLVALIVGPIIATLGALILIPSTVQPVIVQTPEVTSGGAIRAVATLGDIDPRRGEASIRVRFNPEGDLLDAGLLTKEVNVVVAGVGESGVLTFAADEPMGTRGFNLVLDGTPVTRYPFDRYQASLVVTASDVRGDLIPVNLTVVGGFENFEVTGTSTDRARPTDVPQATLWINRNGPVKLWAAILTLLFWLLAAGAVSVLWIVLIESRPVPLWSWAFLTGVLFALPQLRNGLPGSPPLGALVDWAAYYWAVTMVGGSLVTMLVVWNLRARRSDTLVD